MKQLPLSRPAGFGFHFKIEKIIKLNTAWNSGNNEMEGGKSIQCNTASNVEHMYALLYGLVSKTAPATLQICHEKKQMHKYMKSI